MSFAAGDMSEALGLSSRQASQETLPANQTSTPSSPVTAQQAPVAFQDLANMNVLTTILPNRLYFCSLGCHPSSTDTELYFSTDFHLTYTPYFADFGPLNLGCVIRFCRTLQQSMRNPDHTGKKIVYYSGLGGYARANAACLLACFGVLCLGFSAADMWGKLCHSYPPILPFRDASYGLSTYDLTIRDVLDGLQKAISFGWIQVDTFDLQSYEKHETVEGGNWNWIVPGEIIAFSSPMDGVEHREVRPVAQSFRESKVHLVVRLNERLYDRRTFTTFGIEHLELTFPDGAVPQDHHVTVFLEAAERIIFGKQSSTAVDSKVDEGKGGKQNQSKSGFAIAVHCKAGLGRTGTMIGIYLMKHYGFTAKEFMGWARLCRPGSVIGQQQTYLEQMEGRLLRMAAKPMGPSPVMGANRKPSLASSSTQESNSKTVPAVGSAKNVVEEVRSRSISAMELHSRKVQSTASMYDAAYVEEGPATSKWKFESSQSLLKKSMQSPMRQAEAICGAVASRRQLGEVRSNKMPPTTNTVSNNNNNNRSVNTNSNGLQSQLSQNGGKGNRSVNGVAEALNMSRRERTTPSPDFFMNTNIPAVPSVYVSQGKGVPSPVTTLFVTKDVQQSEADGKGPGWLRPTLLEHPSTVARAASSMF